MDIKTGSSSVVSEHQLGDSGQLHIRCAFVDLPDLGIAVVLLDRVVLDKAIAAKNLDRLAGDALGHLGGKVLAHGRFLEEAKTVVLKAGTVVDEQPGGFDLGGHFCEGELNSLKFPNGFAELLTFEGVACGMRPRTLGQTKHLGSNTNTTFVHG